jgi:hypothetical protein
VSSYLQKAEKAIADMKSLSAVPGARQISLATQAALNLQLATVESLHSIEYRLERISEILEPTHIEIAVEPGFPLTSVKAALEENDGVGEGDLPCQVPGCPLPYNHVEGPKHFRYPDKMTERD